MQISFFQMKNAITHPLRKLSFTIKRFISLLPAFVMLLLLYCIHSCSPGNPESSSARIEVSAKSMARKEFIVSLTINGKNFWANKQTYTFNNEGNSVVNINKEECGLLLLKFDDGFVSRMIVAPGDRVMINIITDAQGRPRIEYKGSNATGHQFFNSLERAFIQDVNNPYRLDTNIAVIRHKIQLKMEQELSDLKKLLGKGKISRAYEMLAELDIRYYYAASLADAMCSKYYAARIDHKNKNAVALFSKKYGKAWEQAFTTMPLHSDKALSSEYFRYYVHLYYEWYLGQYSPEKSGLLASDTAGMQGLRKQEGVHILNYAVIDRNFKDSISEYLKAEYLYYAMRRGGYEQSLLTLYTKFHEQYPGSLYTSFLQIEADKILAFQHAKDGDFTPEQVFLTGYQDINSMSELGNVLKNGPYYIDIWATWCAPCKEEFKFNASLSALLREFKVRPLYLSIDKDGEDEDWKNMVKYYKLPGLHLRATDSLRKNIIKEFGKDMLFTIPRYMIINREGIIVNSDAERPSRLDYLREQIIKL